jgi:hypothetical protein
MLARKFSSLGRSLWPRAWRARNATLRPSSVQNVRIGGISKGSLLLDLVRVLETRHVVQTAAADNANLCLLQLRS